MSGAEGLFCEAYVRAVAARRSSALQARESRAGERLQPAGYRPAGTWVRAGGWSAGRGWFCWNVLRSVRARFEVLARRLVCVLCLSYVSIGMSLALDLRLSCGSLGMSCVRSRLLFAAWRQTERLAGCCVPIPPWVVIAIRTFSNRRCGYPALLVHFEIARFLAAIPTGDEGTRGTENGVGGAAWVRFCVNALALLCFPRGVRWG